MLAKVCILAEHDDDKKKEIFNLLREAIYYSYQNGIRSPYKLAGDQILKYLKLLMDDRGKDLNVKENRFLYDLLLRLEEKRRSGGLLSVREIEVLEVLATGASNKEIAECLYISISTVKTHIISIYSKLQVSNRIEAIEKGREKGII